MTKLFCSQVSNRDTRQDTAYPPASQHTLFTGLQNNIIHGDTFNVYNSALFATDTLTEPDWSTHRRRILDSCICFKILPGSIEVGAFHYSEERFNVRKCYPDSCAAVLAKKSCSDYKTLWKPGYFMTL